MLKEKKSEIPHYNTYGVDNIPLFCDEVKTKEQIDDIEDLWKRGYPKKPKRIHRLPEVDVKKVSKSAEGSSKKLHTYPTKDKDLDKMPNQKWHQIVSFIKSGIRIGGYILIPFDLVIATSVLVFSEIIGVVEELV